MISNLPKSINYEELFSKIHGGIVIEAQLLKTHNITKTHSSAALVQFYKQAAAQAFAAFTKEHPLIFRDKEAQVTALTTPTWFLVPQLRYGIDVCKYTRCFEVTNLPQPIEYVITLL